MNCVEKKDWYEKICIVEIFGFCKLSTEDPVKDIKTQELHI